ncbi:MAG: VanZ family protein [Eubacterium sp.]|nr:VanZ family protein [Eubacterium sp.]
MVDEIRQLFTEPAFLVGLGILAVVTGVIVAKKMTDKPSRTVIFSLLLYIYVYVMFSRIVGAPTLDQWRSTIESGGNIFSPVFNFELLAYGFTRGYVLNIFMFIPVGMMVPCICRRYEKVIPAVLFALGLSLFIECFQMFTGYRATDVDDLVTNTLGGIIGYCLYRLGDLMKLFKKRGKKRKGEDICNQIPVFAVVIAFVCVFFG